MADLNGRVALVTGASQGIGRACALVLAQRGAAVALAARSEDKLSAVAQEITGAGGKAGVFRMDVASEDDIRNGIKAAIGQFGKIDILINNAGITRDMLAMRMKRSDWDNVISTNLTSAFVASQAVMSSMLKQRWGRIVNISSIFGQMGQSGQANYAASKAGLIGLTMALARELASRNITVNAVAPGWIQTAMTADLPKELTDQVTKMIPLGRAGTDMEVANAVAFLASDDASYITGHVLAVDGGLGLI
jgi:3-oxoacyl-[acyl-carrier protein] reductase